MRGRFVCIPPPRTGPAVSLVEREFFLFCPWVMFAIIEEPRPASSRCCWKKRFPPFCLSYFDDSNLSSSSSSPQNHPHIKKIRKNNAISLATVIDHDPANTIVCSIGYACRLLPPASWVSKLYPVSPTGVARCCDEGLASMSTGVDPEYCRAKTMGVASRKWFVNYAKAVCVSFLASI